LKALGIAPGDRVAAYVPNLPEVVGAVLGATSLGAVWSSCSPDFGVQGVLDRFGQIEPRVLFTVDGYWYNGKPLSILDKVAEVAARLPTVERVVVIPYLETSGQGPATSRDPQCRELAGIPRQTARRRRSNSRSSLSTIRSTSCSRRARRARPSASCTGRAEPCCSI
jgi:acyl-coenzyme A synthetase/AMP-(fatty) acid ligase